MLHSSAKHSNLTVQHRPHAATKDPRPARTTDIDLRATGSYRGHHSAASAVRALALTRMRWAHAAEPTTSDLGPFPAVKIRSGRGDLAVLMPWAKLVRKSGVSVRRPLGSDAQVTRSTSNPGQFRVMPPSPGRSARRTFHGTRLLRLSTKPLDGATGHQPGPRRPSACHVTTHAAGTSLATIEETGRPAVSVLELEERQGEAGDLREARRKSQVTWRMRTVSVAGHFSVTCSARPRSPSAGMSLSSRKCS